MITGGARGIGKEIVEKFLKNGATVYFIDLNPGEFMDSYTSLAKEAGCEVHFKQANVANEEEITSVLKEIISECGKVDILVNNAGITRDGLIFRMDSKDWHDVLTINLTSAFYISKVIAQHMISKKSGSIINVASVVGVHGNAGQCNYSASKAGMIGLTKSLAKEVAARTIRVNAVAPGYIDTPMTEKLSDKIKDQVINTIPMKRMGQPEEISDVILFLASDLSTYVTGEVIGIDGGMGM